jgi:hypothetical protein
MSRDRIVNSLLLIPALVVVAVEACFLRPAGAFLDWLHRLPKVKRLHERLAQLPPGVALPLFLVPEAASRAGWLASAWLLMTGAAWEALLVYVLTKLVAGITALWVYRACEPALLRVAWFARLHATGQRLRCALKPSGPRFVVAWRRARWSGTR